MMYEVVGCGECRELWIREGDAETATCPRCRKQHQVRKLRALAQAETAEAAREARSALLVARDHDDDGVAGYNELEDQLDEAGIPDDAYLTAHGIDAAAVSDAGERATATPTKRNRREIVRLAIAETETPTEEHIVQTASEHGVEASATRAILKKLLTQGEAVEDSDQYRLL